MEAVFKYKIANSMAEKIQAIGTSTYIQAGTVISIVMLTAWLITFKVNAESEIRQLKSSDERMEKALDEMRLSLPTREWLDLESQNVQSQIEDLKPVKK